MPIVDVLVPQMGEGLQEVLVVEFLKKPGDRVVRDEPFYSMETDKATMEVESPHDGVLVEWLASEGDTLGIGVPVCRMQIDPPPAPEAVGAAASPMAALTDVVAESGGGGSGVRGGQISPRTRAYAKEQGISDDEILSVPFAGAKMMPADIDAYLATRGQAPAPVVAPPPVEASDVFTDRLLSKQDRTFIYRLKRSADMVVPAVAKRQMDWGTIRRFADKKKAEGGANPPSSFNCMAYCIAQAVKEHPKFRSALVREDTVREYNHLNLGIAVATPTGELTIAVVHGADALRFDDFVRVSQQNISAAREGDDQADESVQLLLTYMGPYEITDAVPVLVAPAAAVLFIGSAFTQGDALVVNLVLTFDHRLIHGVEAAEFLRAIVQKAMQIEELIR